jgi:hypothetical protein
VEFIALVGVRWLNVHRGFCENRSNCSKVKIGRYTDRHYSTALISRTYIPGGGTACSPIKIQIDRGTQLMRSKIIMEGVTGQVNMFMYLGLNVACIRNTYADKNYKLSKDKWTNRKEFNEQNTKKYATKILSYKTVIVPVLMYDLEL